MESFSKIFTTMSGDKYQTTTICQTSDIITLRNKFFCKVNI